jgi:hypothetical protein
LTDGSACSALRVDLVSTLRAVIDDEQSKSRESGSADLAKLITAVEALKLSRSRIARRSSSGALRREWTKQDVRELKKVPLLIFYGR